MTPAPRRIIIPVFLNSLGCPSLKKCVFCNQSASGGASTQPEDTRGAIISYIRDIQKTNIRPSECFFEIAFYGGTFTALPLETQSKMFRDASDAMAECGLTSEGGFRISTRPDYIDATILEFLKNSGVMTIEVGVESFDDGVLALCGRGYSGKTAFDALRLIKKSGFTLSAHLMCGLPGQTRGAFFSDAASVVDIAPEYARIHPLCVIKNTSLEKEMLAGRFVPQPDDELISQAAYALCLFELNGIRVIRVGILENENFRKDVLCGPSYPNLREVVEGRIHSAAYGLIRQAHPGGECKITVTGSMKTLNYVIGYRKENMKKNNDLVLEFKSEMLYNTTEHDNAYLNVAYAEHGYCSKSFTRNEILLKYIDNI